MTKQVMGVSDSGKVVDNIVERMFHDLYYGTFTEDDITIRNFNHYLRQFYKFDGYIDSFDDTSGLLAAALTCFNQIIMDRIIHEDGPFKIGVRFAHWEHGLYAQHEGQARAIALAIVQNMRDDAGEHLNPVQGGATH